MKNKLMNLHIFDGEGTGGDGGTGNPNGNGGTGSSGQNGNTGYTFEQAEEIANSRAQKAERAALASFYRQQGLSEEQITTAIADFKECSPLCAAGRCAALQHLYHFAPGK